MRLRPISSAIALSIGMLAGCGQNGSTDDVNPQQQPSSVSVVDGGGTDSMAARDPGAGEKVRTKNPDPEVRPVMQVQVVLERLGFGPGVVDGNGGPSLVNALKGFQESRDLPVTGMLDAATKQALARWDNIPATRIVTIPESWGEITFTAIPDGAALQAKMPQLGYESIAEKLAERFHTTPQVLARLNPGGRPATDMNRTSTATTATSPASDTERAGGSGRAYSPGQELRVPNIGADQIDASLVDDKVWLETLRYLGVGTDQPRVSRILVDESDGWLKGYDKHEQLVAMYTVTTGSKSDPLPLGEWGIAGLAFNPSFAFDPKLFWDVSDSEDKQQLPPGPNGPVGVVWIDLTKEHYGIHGTPAPETIGRAQSHGCIRLTNWDAARLAQMVSGSTKVFLQK